jgi:hypothetical protein
VALVAPVSNASPSNEPPFVDRRYNVTISLHVHVVNVKFLTLKGVTDKVRRCNADLSIGTFFNIGLKCTVRRTAGLIMIIIIIFLHGLGPLTCSGIDALPSFPRTSTISSSSRFVVKGVFRDSGVVRSFKTVDPVLFCLDLTSCIPEISSS